MSPRLNVNLTLFVIRCHKQIWASHISNVPSIIIYWVILIQVSIIHDNISSHTCQRQNTPDSLSIIGTNFIQISIIHANICKLIHKMCLKKSCHNDKEYDVTLNAIFGGASQETQSELNTMPWFNRSLKCFVWSTTQWPLDISHELSCGHE